MSGTKTLFIVRHAKSRWNPEDIVDHERPLNERGFREAGLMANRLADVISAPEYWVSSTALRAKTTASIFLEAFKEKQDIHLNKDIYEASYSSLFPIINSFPETVESAVLFGHNPSLSYLVSGLTNTNLAMQTCCVTEVELLVSEWADVAAGVGMLKMLDYPRKNKMSK